MININKMQEKCDNIARKMEGKCISTYTNYHTKLEWECKKGHRFYSLLSNVKSKHWCPHCVGLAKKSINDCNEIASKFGGKCISSVYENNRKDMLWECKNGHCFSRAYSEVQSGSWCLRCDGRAKKTIDDCMLAAKEKNGKCLSKKYIDSMHKLDWECEEGHVWKARYNLINSGSWCPYCAGKHITIADCVGLAKNKNGKCISEVYMNNKTKLEWECAQGHRFFADRNHVKSGRWCPCCSGHLRKTIKDMHEIANCFGGKCLSEEYINSESKLKWECANGHQFLSNYNHVSVGKWCAQCKNKTQTKVMEIIKSIFNSYEVLSNYRGFDWLVGLNGRRLEIDIYIKEIGLAIEYDGEQHFMPINFGRSNRDNKDIQAAFKDTQNRDRIKNRLIKNHKTDVKFFIRFNYRQNLTKEFVMAELKKIEAYK